MLMMEKFGRPQRNRRHSRRAWPPEDDLQLRPVKRLFTPDIKRMLKDWLIRRRENPYPSRDEKKRLAIESGLTYTQICNWFANWRRKLKNSERERTRKSWGHLIKHYNTNAKGNVEQFSISSEDSIWEEEELNQIIDIDESRDEGSSSTDIERIGISMWNANCDSIQRSDDYNRMDYGNKGYYLTPNILKSTDSKDFTQLEHSPFTNNAKYKQKMMEKYLRDINSTELTDSIISTSPRTNQCTHSEAELSKWLASAEKFTPEKNNYYVNWDNSKNKSEFKKSSIKSPTLDHKKGIIHTNIIPAIPHQSHLSCDSLHHKDELDAAEALTKLAFNCRQRILKPGTTLSTPLSQSAISF